MWDMFQKEQPQALVQVLSQVRCFRNEAAIHHFCPNTISFSLPTLQAVQTLSTTMFSTIATQITFITTAHNE